MDQWAMRMEMNKFYRSDMSITLYTCFKHSFAKYTMLLVLSLTDCMSKSLSSSNYLIKKVITGRKILYVPN